MRTLMLVFLAAGVFACADQSYAYRPDNPNAVDSGLPAERTPIPQERPQGAVEVTSYGTTELQQGDARVPSLHVRMIVTNDGDDTPWTIDTRRQAVEIPGEGRTTPIYANADVQTMPVLTVTRGAKRVIDLYFPLPATMADDAHLPRFEMMWEVNTPARIVASRTSFDRVALEPPPDVAYGYDVGWYGGYGPYPYWWYDSYYSPGVFVHSRPIVIRDHSSRVHVGRFGGHFRAGGGGHIARGGGGHRR